MSEMRKVNWGGTDCSLPMTWALENRVEVDTFVVITDNETWAGKIHPFQALKQYRKSMGIDAKLAVLGVSATDFSIADSSDRGMMDFCGFDASGPRVLADFSAGRI
jgi:60 kDa SS-A/Ro ribonucleoprotein